MDFDRVCENNSFATVRCLSMEDARGADVVVVVAKMAYEVTPRGVAILRSTPIRITDTAGGDRGSIRYPTDFVFEKPGTDVILVGTAIPPETPPGAEPVTEMDVALRVGLLDKIVRVYGPRVYYQGLAVAPGPPGRLEPTPLVYELSYGGRDEREPSRSERRNPLGKGFAVDRARLVGTEAPCIEDPRVALPARLTTPAGFGAVGTDWEPRLRFAGTYDKNWRRDRAPVRPSDFDVRYNSVASPGLWSQTPLLGDEPIEVLGATPEGLWRFRLPQYAPLFSSVTLGERAEHPAHLDTLLIDADERLVELTWRVAIPIPRKAELIEHIEVAGSSSLPETAFVFPNSANHPAEEASL